jgi:hypothetical protein
MTTQATPQTFAFNRLAAGDTLLAALAAIEEHLSGEIAIADQVLVTCSSPRSVAIVGMLMGELEPMLPQAPQLKHEQTPEVTPSGQVEATPKAPPSETGEHGVCVNCLRPFAPKRKDSRFCSKACRDEFKSKKPGQPVVEESGAPDEAPAGEETPSPDASINLDPDPGYLVIKTGEFISKADVEAKLARGEMWSGLRLRRAGDGEFEVFPLSTGQQILRRVL